MSVVEQDRAAEHDVLADAKIEIEQLRQGLESRTIVGRAEGILMERQGINADAAFEYLRRVSSHSNRKLIDIATEIAETRELPKI